MHAYWRGTRRKYVRVGSSAASMPHKVPRRYARKHLRLSSATDGKAASGCRIESRSVAFAGVIALSLPLPAVSRLRKSPTLRKHGLPARHCRPASARCISAAG
ncbi:hypothetical protein XcyCFBP4188_21040 [Xanthomonas hortorum pv. cynarae]|nr:hypothetical protein XcyCFBP4188_21040 [Xanthomonas hortorum pv. cynarae]